MAPVWMLAAILLPMLGGAGLLLLKKKQAGTAKLLALALTCATSILVWALILTGSTETFRLASFTDGLIVAYRLDGLGRFFAGILATLWPVTVLYALSYMEHEPRQIAFFSFFTMSYAASLGVAMSSNLFTLYFNYELLTLATMPLVLHPMTRAASKATRTYLFFSLGGAAFAFASMIFLIANGADGSFTLGGLLTGHPYGPEITRIFYVLGFFGFGVKAAVFPLHVWLPRAAVAPTPVTALLHAVAVVKAGAFAVIRLTWFCFGTDLLAGTWAQWVPMLFIIFTILYGSVMAVKCPHWKRRLAYSTVANLSYVLFGALLMTSAGLAAGLLHMAAHACIKILAFFCAGAVLHRTGREYNVELDGLGRKMPLTFACFTVSALALTGIPPFNGFVSKWYLLTASAEAGTTLAYAGAAALLISALLTAIYMFTVVSRAWFPRRDGPAGPILPRDAAPRRALPARCEADWRMNLPDVLLALATLAAGLFSQPIIDAVERIVSHS